ncbi:MAG: metal-dependent hydrolase [Pseudomonadota bacterium]
MSDETSVWAVTWLGHSSFRIETGGRTLLVDPWLKGNPSFPEERFDEAIAGVSHILLSHGHFDHIDGVKEIAAATGATVVGIYELISWLGVEASVGLNKGGTVTLGDPAQGAVVEATMVNAVHSSSTIADGRPVYLGGEAGWMLRSHGQSLYYMGDTDVMADMQVFQQLHQPRIGIVPIGGHFTMDSKRAAFACKTFFDFETVIPCHYATFELLEQSADAFAEAVAPMQVNAPQVFETVRL